MTEFPIRQMVIMYKALSSSVVRPQSRKPHGQQDGKDDKGREGGEVRDGEKGKDGKKNGRNMDSRSRKDSSAARGVRTPEGSAGQCCAMPFLGGVHRAC